MNGERKTLYGGWLAGPLRLTKSGLLAAGQTGFDQGSGLWLACLGEAFRFSLGQSGGQKLIWDGTALAFAGALLDLAAQAAPGAPPAGFTRLYARADGQPCWQAPDGAEHPLGGASDHGALTGLGDDDHPQYVSKKSTNRPGVDRIFRRDSDTPYNLQHHFDGTYWVLRGYNNDAYHAKVRSEAVFWGDIANRPEQYAAFTPAWQGLSGALQNNSGDYYTLGELVFVRFTIQGSGLASAGGFATRITNLPVAAHGYGLGHVLDISGNNDYGAGRINGTTWYMPPWPAYSGWIHGQALYHRVV